MAPARISVRVADIVYRLAAASRRSSTSRRCTAQMQIDEFSAAYDWDGTTLRFSDAAKDVRYEVRIGARRTAAR